MFQFVQDIYHGVKTFLVGMKVTGGYLKGANSARAREVTTTIEYDGTPTLAKDVKVAAGFRGHLQLDPAQCIVCKACAKACPIDCFYIDGERNAENKMRASRFDIDLLKCMYCGLCVEACPTECLKMTPEWWGATFSRDDNTNFHGQIRHFGLGYYTQAEKTEIERQRLEMMEAKKKAALAAAAAKKAAASASATAAGGEVKRPAQPGTPTASPAAAPAAGDAIKRPRPDLTGTLQPDTKGDDTGPK